MMMVRYAVVLEDGTVGEIVTNQQDWNKVIGETFTVSLRDENGNWIHKSGIVEDIIDESYEWDGRIVQ